MSAVVVWFISRAGSHPTAVKSELTANFESLATVLAFKWPLAGVVHQVELETGVGGERFSTLLTFKRLVVSSAVMHQILEPLESLSANFAFERPLIRVKFEVRL